MQSSNRNIKLSGKKFLGSKSSGKRSGTLTNKGKQLHWKIIYNAIFTALREHLRAHKAVLYLSIFLLFYRFYSLVPYSNYLFCIKESSIGILIGHFSKINKYIEKQASVMFINTYPRFPPFLLHFRCKLGVTCARRCFRDGI